NPTALAFHDINQDGLNDLIVLVPYEKIKVLLQVPDKPFDEQDVAPPGGSAEQPWLSMADVDGDGKPELLLAQKNFLRAVVWQVVRTLPLPVSDFSSRQAVALGAANPNSIALMSLNSAAWMAFEGDVWELSELDGYETPIKDGYLNDVVSGDLNNDGRKDLVFLETAKNQLDIVTFEPPHQLVPASRWQVFEERTFRGRRSDLPEPREALIADVTG